MITNIQRLEYILDVIAEPFPQNSNGGECGCGDDDAEKKNVAEKKQEPPTSLRSQEVPLAKQTVRGLVESALTEALPSDWKQEVDGGDGGGEKLGLLDIIATKLLKHFDLEAIDSQMRDLALFLDPNRPVNTTLVEIVAWDKARYK